MMLLDQESYGQNSKRNQIKLLSGETSARMKTLKLDAWNSITE